MRQIFLDTETTGLEHKLGHRVIEVGCVEMVNRRLTNHHFHHYLNPDRDIDAGARLTFSLPLGTPVLPLEHAPFRPSVGLRPDNVAVLVALRLVVPFGASSLPHDGALAPVGLTILSPIVIAISRSCPDLELVQLVPFRIGTIALRDGEEFANPATHIDWLHIIHLNIMNHSPSPFNIRRKLLRSTSRAEKRIPKQTASASHL